MKNLFLFVLLTMSMVGNLRSSAARVVLGSLVIGGGLTALGKAENSQILDKLSCKCNMSKEDLHAAMAASIMLYGIGCLPIGQELGLPLRQFAFRTPLIAALVGLVSSQAIKNMVAQIPGIGLYFGACNNNECAGSCNECKVRTTIIALTLWRHAFGPKVDAFERSRVGGWFALS